MCLACSSLTSSLFSLSSLSASQSNKSPPRIWFHVSMKYVKSDLYTLENPYKRDLYSSKETFEQTKYVFICFIPTRHLVSCFIKYGIYTNVPQNKCASNVPQMCLRCKCASNVPQMCLKCASNVPQMCSQIGAIETHTHSLSLSFSLWFTPTHAHTRTRTRTHTRTLSASQSNKSSPSVLFHILFVSGRVGLGV